MATCEEPAAGSPLASPFALRAVKSASEGWRRRGCDAVIAAASRQQLLAELRVCTEANVQYEESPRLFASLHMVSSPAVLSGTPLLIERHDPLAANGLHLCQPPNLHSAAECTEAPARCQACLCH